MTYLTGKQILDDALSLIQDSSPATRAKALVWLNVVAQKLATVRPWMFLENTATIIPTGNVLAYPTDYGEFRYLQGGTAFYFDGRKRLSPGEAWQIDNTYTGYTTPVGFTEDEAGITLHGASSSAAVTLGYVAEPPAITDSTAATLWPVKAKALLMRAVVDFFYEYDMDDRKAVSFQINAAELSELKKWDNSQKAKTQVSRHGYRRTR